MHALRFHRLQEQLGSLGPGKQLLHRVLRQLVQQRSRRGLIRSQRGRVFPDQGPDAGEFFQDVRRTLQLPVQIPGAAVFHGVGKLSHRRAVLGKLPGRNGVPGHGIDRVVSCAQLRHGAVQAGHGLPGRDAPLPHRAKQVRQTGPDPVRLLVKRCHQIRNRFVLHGSAFPSVFLTGSSRRGSMGNLPTKVCIDGVDYIISAKMFQGAASRHCALNMTKGPRLLAGGLWLRLSKKGKALFGQKACSLPRA